MPIRPIVGITMGDPAGIGPEICLRTAVDPRVQRAAVPVIVGDRGALERVRAASRVRRRIRPVGSPAEARGDGAVEVLDLKNVDLAACPLGVVSAAAGRAAVEYVFRSIELATAGQIAAAVTAPLNKEAMRQAGFPYDGHTEIYAEKTGTRDYSMMLVVGRLRVLHVSTHVALREAVTRVARERVLTVIRLAGVAARMLGVRAPRIGVAGLNPHAGEGGLFGREEIEQITPAIEAARAEGFDVHGPISADTLLYRARRGEFDFVVAMYHDQGHVPLKLIGFDRGINVTVGLPMIRTSVDHGTAFDIVGTGKARHASLVAATLLAVRMARRWRPAGGSTAMPA
ncbi:MAG TPA: 4-hydroxythreonine-4-phosphate dehydrogenase PdxA [Candidatus Methylomirabilis sp.]|jgi:4-hydroxythreonine-4-phosphate dehydrogenase|nr:4-hydroxythreonine-4-phosphate dehydrogenase PdxA [Candidatus Methylomirabilis sp.]